MNVFFGKFSASNEKAKNQIDEKRYYAKKEWNGFGDIKEGDYCYIISGKQIYLWKAKKFEKEFLQFEAVINNPLPIDGNKFRALNIFEFNSDLMVLTHRHSTKAFYNLKLSKEITEEQISNIEFYEDSNNFRKFFVVSEDYESFNEDDIYLIKTFKNEFVLNKSSFFDNKLSFFDNTKYQDGKRKSKNSLLKKITKATLNQNIELSLNSFYDAFFVSYDKDNELKKKLNNKKSRDNMQIDIEQKQPLNQILYGPPGTGKTYNTIDKALNIIFKKEDMATKFYDFEQKQISYNDVIALTDDNIRRKALKGVFEYFVENGQIDFVTFHQSYGYEEFVEGIKAQTVTDDESKRKTITYDIEDGIFKKICEQAKTIKTEKKSIYSFDEENINIWKISLGDSQNSDDDFLFDYCTQNNKILLGFGEGLDFSDCSNRKEIAEKLNDNEKYSYPPTAINTLKNKIKKNDIILVSYGNKKLRAIAKVTDDYSFINDDELKSYVQSRGVEWLLIPNEPFSYEKVLKKQFSQMSIYDIKSNVKIEDLKSLLTSNDKKNENKNYILIIDEINRGNISKIFGELITLIEDSKRLGETEQVTITLPYSGLKFGVPNNLYILGTMNTADRSIALMDTALRRRFHFEEMMAKSELLENIEIDELDIKALFETINKRIEYLYDRDHTIGHAYFMSLNGIERQEDKLKELDNIFRNKIIPLLQEYFYDDWEKIQIILGDHISQFDKKNKKETQIEFFYEGDDCINKYRFIQSIESKEEDILGFDHEDIENEQLNFKISSSFEIDCYKKIYDTKEKETYKKILSEIEKVKNEKTDTPK